MARITLRQLLDHAAEYGYGVPAYNINTMEQCLAIMAAAEATCSPVILQATTVTRKYFNDILLERLMDGLVAMYPSIPICIHQDHASDVDTCVSAIQHGFTSVMIDGTLGINQRTPTDFSYNVRMTRRVTQLAHGFGVSVEGALGLVGSLESCLGSLEDGHGADAPVERELLLTDPNMAVEFVKQTHVDALAIAIGTSHGAFKFSHKPDGASLHLQLIAKIHSLLPYTHLVMHGCSSIPEQLQQMFNSNGGLMPPTWGIPVGDIQWAIEHGLRKINIDTDNRLAMTAYLRRSLQDHPREIDPRKYLREAMEGVTQLCRQRFEDFGTAGHAARLRPLSGEAMVDRYKNGW